MSSPFKSPFADYYRQQQETANSATLGKRRRNDSSGNENGAYAWNPTEHKRIKKDFDTIYKNTIHILQKNSSKQTTILDSQIRTFDVEGVKEPSDGSPCGVCVSFTSDQGICEVCTGRVCLDCMFQCEICAQICCNVCKLVKYVFCF